MPAGLKNKLMSLNQQTQSNQTPLYQDYTLEAPVSLI